MDLGHERTAADKEPTGKKWLRETIFLLYRAEAGGEEAAAATTAAAATVALFSAKVANMPTPQASREQRPVGCGTDRTLSPPPTATCPRRSPPGPIYIDKSFSRT
ncbi:hypothetical protein GWI33_021843 [Rhynchophorus ferrugineus]|uniref:Uncharacterized protein n=1 Tax=Rhynchophorus ferrugineus TaxID=354439 RepID=A0A834IP95_RHYFE|nr:hypothetical protein GWI33_021843 [Rhynchophorus ferrugineus]